MHFAHFISRGRSVFAALACVSTVFLITGCGQSKDGASQAGGAPPAAQVSVAPAVQRQIQESDEFTGRLEATESVDVRPRVSGTIDRVHFREGQLVKKGDLLFTVDARPFRAELARAEAQLASAQTQSELSKTEFARAQKLLDVKAISKQEFDQLQSGTRSSDASIRAAQAAVQAARLNVEYATIRAPIAGRVSRANVTAGNLVGNAEPVLTSIVSQGKVYAYFDASEQVYLRYAKQARTAASSKSGDATTGNTVMMGLANDAGYPHKGVIDFVDNRLNAQTGAIRVRAAFDNSKGEFTPGLFARVRLLGSGATNAVLTPDRAIGTDQTKKYVLVVGADNVANFREVKLGSLDGGMRVVTEGLKAGEMVIVDGLQRVRPGMPVAPQKVDIDGNGMPVEKPSAPPGAPPKEDGKEKQAPAAKKEEKKA